MILHKSKKLLLFYCRYLLCGLQNLNNNKKKHYLLLTPSKNVLVIISKIYHTLCGYLLTISHFTENNNENSKNWLLK